MKRILSFVLSLVFIIGILPCLGVAAEEEVMTATDRVIAQMRDIGIMQGDENGEIEPAATLSRAEFVTLIARIMGIEHHYDSAENDLFVDVPQNHWAKSAILACAKAGYVIGTDDGIFSPEDNVSLEQAVKIMVKVLGYEFMAQEKGGYPAGHFYAANRLELLENIDMPQTDPVTKGDAAHLFFNALEVPLTEEVGYSEGSVLMSNLAQRTLLAEYLGLARAEGRLDAIYGLSVIDEEISEAGQIIVDGKLYAYEGKDLRNLVGRTVDYFYTIGENQLKSTVKSILPAQDANQELKIMTDDLIDVKNGIIIYEDENENQKEVEIDATIKYVYNYGLLLDYDIKDLKTIQNGQVVLVNNDEDHGYEFAFIYDYETYIVESKSDNMIQGKLNDSIIDLTKDKRITFLNYHDGREVSLNKIKPNHILFVIETDEILEMHINDTNVTGTLESTGKDSITVNGTKYDVAKNVFPQLNQLDLTNVKLGETASIYLNPYHQVAYMTAVGVGELQVGYMMKTAETGGVFSSGMQAKIFTEMGEIKTFPFAKNIMINGTSYTVSKHKDAIEKCLGLRSEIASWGIQPQLLKYGLNESGEIYELLLAKETLADENEDGFMLIYGADTYEAGVMKHGQTVNRYSSTLFNASGDPISTLNTKAANVFVVPTWKKTVDGGKDPVDEENDYRIVTPETMPKSGDYGTQNAKVYHNSKGDSVASYMVIHTDNALGDGNTQEYQPLYVFVGLTNVWVDGETKPAMEYFNGSEVVTSMISDDAWRTSASAFTKLKKGDAIQVAFNKIEEVTKTNLIYDGTTINRAAPSNRLYYDVSLGYVVHLQGDYVRISPDKKTVNNGNELLACYLMPASASNIIIVENRNGKTLVSKGTQQDIMVGSKVVYRRRYGDVTTYIIYK